MANPLIIYHANCADGFGAAYAAYYHFCFENECQCEFVAASHGEAPPEVSGREVYLLDFSYKRAVLKALCEQAKQVVVIDHHISAAEDLQGLDQECPNLSLHLDMDKSGAVLAWEYFHDPNVPRLLLHVQDQDLWRFKLPYTKEINAALMAYPFDFKLWNTFAEDDASVQALVLEGETIGRYRAKLIAAYKKRARMAEVAGFKVPVVNCPPELSSELLGELAEQHPFAAGYHDKDNRRAWSLRSRGDSGADVAKIAAQFGGGGHRNAAGFATRLPDLDFTPPDA